jgi:hypothetical protein
MYVYIYTIIHAFVQIDIKQAKESAALHITLGDKCHPLHMAIARFTQTTSKASSWLAVGTNFALDPWLCHFQNARIESYFKKNVISYYKL